eukprot:6140614-Pyramimonas_sp.AAC.1
MEQSLPPSIHPLHRRYTSNRPSINHIVESFPCPCGSPPHPLPLPRALTGSISLFWATICCS